MREPDKCKMDDKNRFVDFYTMHEHMLLRMNLMDEGMQVHDFKKLTTRRLLLLLTRTKTLSPSKTGSTLVSMSVEGCDGTIDMHREKSSTD